MKKVIKYAVLNENQYNGREGYDIYQLSQEIIAYDICYTLFDFLCDNCEIIDIEILGDGDFKVGTDYYILISDTIIYVA
jgi:hypothetical protein